MNPIRFWLLFAALVSIGVAGFCRIAPANGAAPPTIKPKPVVSKPTIRLDQPSRVLVQYGLAYRAEYRKPKTAPKKAAEKKGR